MSKPFRVACIQNRATAVEAEGVAEAEALARDAARDGANLLCLPELFACLSVVERRMEVGARAEAGNPVVERFAGLARETGCHVLLGSIAIRTGSGRIRNRSLLIDPAGAVVARYDKVHLFDVDLGEGQCYRESDSVEPGDRAVIASTPWGQIGLSVCYDLRFAHLYRALAKAGARYLTVPAAFTRTTGRAHWHVLLRARAIETGCYVFAPGQYGDHGEARTYGHSLVVDPWGDIVAEAGEGPAWVVAEVDPARVDEARRRIPSLEHDRPFDGPAPAAVARIPRRVSA